MIKTLKTLAFIAPFALITSAISKESVWLSSEGHDVLLVLSKIESVEMSDKLLVIRTDLRDILVQPDETVPEFKGFDIGKAFVSAFSKLINGQKEITDASTAAAEKILLDTSNAPRRRQMAAADAIAGSGIFRCATIKFAERKP